MSTWRLTDKIRTDLKERNIYCHFSRGQGYKIADAVQQRGMRLLFIAMIKMFAVREIDNLDDNLMYVSPMFELSTKSLSIYTDIMALLTSLKIVRGLFIGIQTGGLRR